MAQVIKLDKYEKNLAIRGIFVYSYEVRVAQIGRKYVHEMNWWKYSNEHDGQTQTTKRHINYVAEYLGKKVKSYSEQVKQHTYNDEYRNLTSAQKKIQKRYE